MAKLGSISAAVLLMLAAHQAAASSAATASTVWNSAPGCTDEEIGESVVFGVQGDSKPMETVDQTAAWRQYGQITKVNLYYSWNYGCLQGFKVTYGYKAGDAKLLGHEKNLYTQDLTLGSYEHIVKADIKQQPNKCIEFIKLYTDKGRHLSFGNAKSTAPTQLLVGPEGAFVAAIKGQHDLVTENGQQVAGGLQNVLFVWGKEVCPATTPTAEPPAWATGNPSAPPQQEPLCPSMPALCDASAQEGTVAFCPVTSPFTEPQCVGGCCVSSGKCKMPLCKLNGLGTDVMALDFICYGKNDGLFGGLNKCRNLACKLAVPGCTSGLLGGNCIGVVVADNPDSLDPMAKQYVGKPCLEVLNKMGVKHMPLNKLAKPSADGDYVSGLWSVCDCKATPSPVLPVIPFFDIKKQLLGKKHPIFAALLAGATAGIDCNGPLCALLPTLPSMNATMTDLQIPMTLLSNMTALLKPKPLELPAIAGMVPQIQLPELEVSVKPLTLPDILPTFDQCVGYFINVTNILKPAIEAVLPTTHTLATTDLITIVADLLPQIRFEVPQLDVTKMPTLQLPDLTSLVTALLPKVPVWEQIKLNMPGINLAKFVEKVTVPMQ